MIDTLAYINGTQLNNAQPTTQAPVLANVAAATTNDTQQQNSGVVAQTDQSNEQNVSPRQQVQVQPTAVQQSVEQKGTAAPAETVDNVNLPPISTTTTNSAPPQGQNTNDTATAQQPGSDESRIKAVELWQKWVGQSLGEPMTKEQLEAQKKKRRRQAIFAAIGDGISAMSNLFFTGQYGTPNAYDPKNSMSTKLKEQWDKTDKDRKANDLAFYNGYINAKKMDDAAADSAWNKQHTLAREAVQDKQRAEDIEYRNKQAEQQQSNWQKQFDQNKLQSDRSYDLQKTSSDRSHNLQQQQLAHSVRQSNMSNALRQQELSINGAQLGGARTIYLNDGTVAQYNVSQEGALTSLLPKMITKAKQAAARYRSKGDNEKAQHYSSLARVFEGTKSKQMQVAQVAANVWDFPSLDKEVRKIIGAETTVSKDQFRRRGNDYNEDEAKLD